MERTISFREAINEAMAEEMRRDPSVIIVGEDLGLSLLGQTAGQLHEFGDEIIVNIPVAENALAGVGIGAAMNGLRPILEFLLCDFALLLSVLPVVGLSLPLKNTFSLFSFLILTLFIGKIHVGICTLRLHPA